MDFNWLNDLGDGWDAEGDVLEVAELVRDRIQAAMDEIDALTGLIDSEEAGE